MGLPSTLRLNRLETLRQDASVRFDKLCVMIFHISQREQLIY
ncbi:hypothetical protein PRUB_a4829 [Pseudoalteromonas rubra]|uniref:Uncharacterized protein n=1 Tax=Pseudoalteromonas rubra TaxID=43658 RepID=A0A8T0C9J3_9GAMM|nr:hypothetical protein PRUB_a4829 [Pseudoalteromonas rubra]